MVTQIETLPFQAEVQELLSLVIHSLYKHREIFLRELVSNASDALDKLAFEALTRPELEHVGETRKIWISIDREKRSLTVSDNGIGMDRHEIEENLGTIARSGTRQFLARLREARAENAPELIGQFGVGFYSSFMVAREVVVETRRADADQGWRWRSEGEGQYTIEACAFEGHGTRVTLHLRADDADSEETQDFLSEWTIRDVIKRYSDFVAYPIELDVDDEKGGRRIETINSMKPLWARPKDEITRAEHDEFYRHLTHDFEAPLEVIHLKAEGTTEYTALLYVPAERPLDLFEAAETRSRIALYVKRVLIMPDCADLLPSWMRFVRGVVDSSDLPLNVSRDVLQANPTVRQIRKRLVKRVLDVLTQMLADDREKFRRFWNAFGVLMKEAIYLGEDPEKQIQKMVLFETSWHADGHEPEPTTLAEYVARMKPEQKAIYTLAGGERVALENSPQLEYFRKRGLEVLLLVDPVDEWVVERMREFEDRPLTPIDRGELDLVTESEKQVRLDLERDHRDLLAALEECLAKDIQSVRYSTRLSDSPALLTSAAGQLSPNMERVLRASRRDVPHTKRILELNPDHGAVKRLSALFAKAPRSDDFREMAEMLYGQALLAEGSPLSDGARFAKLVAKWLAGEPRAV